MDDILIGRNDRAAVEIDPHFGNRHGMLEPMGKQAVRTMSSQPGRQIIRGVLGGIFGGRR